MKLDRAPPSAASSLTFPLTLTRAPVRGVRGSISRAPHLARPVVHGVSLEGHDVPEEPCTVAAGDDALHTDGLTLHGTIFQPAMRTPRAAQPAASAALKITTKQTRNSLVISPAPAGVRGRKGPASCTKVPRSDRETAAGMRRCQRLPERTPVIRRGRGEVDQFLCPPGRAGKARILVSFSRRRPRQGAAPTNPPAGPSQRVVIVSASGERRRERT